MRLDFSCFISHRSSEKKLAGGMVKAIYDALAEELEIQVDEGVHPLRAGPGDILDPALAEALCRTSCMVLLFTGNYFSRKHPYCTREYLLMRDLEAQRLKQSGVAVSKKNGLIIPVVLSNPERMPAELTKRIWSDFQSFEQTREGIEYPRTFFGEIRKIAQYIERRHTALSALPEPATPCDGLNLPDDQRVQEFLSALAKGGRDDSKDK
jgi:hypothetical protein